MRLLGERMFRYSTRVQSRLTATIIDRRTVTNADLNDGEIELSN